MVQQFGNGTGDDFQMATGWATRWPQITGSVIRWLSRNQSVAISARAERGFSFLEILVSIGIFAIITTAVVVNFRSGQHSNELRLAAEGLASDLRSLYTTAQAGTATSFAVGTLALTLPATINVQEIKPSNLTTVKFEPPEPQVQFFDNNDTAILDGTALIILQHTKTSQTKTVIIKRVSGRIAVE